MDRVNDAAALILHLALSDQQQGQRDTLDAADCAGTLVMAVSEAASPTHDFP